MSDTNAAATLTLKIDTESAAQNLNKLKESYEGLRKELGTTTSTPTQTKQIGEEAQKSSSQISNLTTEIESLKKQNEQLKASLVDVADKFTHFSASARGGAATISASVSGVTTKARTDAKDLSDTYKSLAQSIIDSKKSLADSGVDYWSTKKEMKSLQDAASSSISKLEAYINKLKVVRNTLAVTGDAGVALAMQENGKNIVAQVANLDVLEKKLAGLKALTGSGLGTYLKATMGGLYEQVKVTTEGYDSLGKKILAANRLVAEFGVENAKAFLGKNQFLINMIADLDKYKTKIKEVVTTQDAATKAAEKAAAAQAAAIQAAANAAQRMYGNFTVANPAGQQKIIDKVELASLLSAEDATRRYGASIAGLVPMLPQLVSEQKKVADSHTQAATAASAHERQIRGMPQHLWELHSAARGLAGGLGMLWTTYGSTIPLVAGAALSGSFLAAAKSGAEFTHQLAFVSALGGETATTMEGVSAAILSLSKTSMTGPVELASGMRILSQAGLDAKDALIALPHAMNLAVVGEMNMQDAAVTLTGVMNAFNLSINSVSHVGDVFAKAAAMSQTSVSGMTQAMKAASVVGEQYGASMEDTASAITLLAKVNITGTAAGTALRNMLKELYTPGKQAEQVFKTLGVSARTAEGDLRSFPDIIFDLKDKLAQFNEASRVNILQKLFGERGAKEAVAMLNLTKDKWMELRSAIADSDGFMSRVSSQLESGFKGSVLQAINTFKANLIDAFQASEVQFTSISNSLKRLADSEEVKSALRSMVGLIASLGDAAVTAAPYLIRLAEAWVAFKGVALAVGAITAVTAELAAFASGIGIVAEVAAATAGGALLGFRSTLVSTGAAAAVASGSAGLGALSRVVTLLSSPLSWLVTGLGLLGVALYKSANDVSPAIQASNNFIEILKDENRKLDDNIAKLRERNALLKGGGSSPKLDAIQDQRARLQAAIDKQQAIVDDASEHATVVSVAAKELAKLQAQLAELNKQEKSLIEKEDLSKILAAKNGLQELRNALKSLKDEAAEKGKTSLVESGIKSISNLIDIYDGSSINAAGLEQLKGALTRQMNAVRNLMDGTGTKTFVDPEKTSEIIAQIERRFDGEILAIHEGAKREEEAVKIDRDNLVISEIEAINKTRDIKIAAGVAAYQKYVQEMAAVQAAGGKGSQVEAIQNKAIKEQELIAKAYNEGTDGIAKVGKKFYEEMNKWETAAFAKDKTTAMDEASLKIQAIAKTVESLGKSVSDVDSERLSKIFQIIIAEALRKDASASMQNIVNSVRTGLTDLTSEISTFESEMERDGGWLSRIFNSQSITDLIKSKIPELQKRLLEVKAILDVKDENGNPVNDPTGQYTKEYAQLQKQIDKSLNYVPKVWKDIVSGIDNTFHEGFTAIFSKGETDWKAFGKKLTASFKTLVMDAIYQMIARPLVMNIVANIAGSVGLTGVAAAANTLAGSNSTVGSIAGTANTASSLYNMTSKIYEFTQGQGAAYDALASAYNTVGVNTGWWGTSASQVSGGLGSTASEAFIDAGGLGGTSSGAAAGLGAYASMAGWMAVAYAFMDWFSKQGGGAKVDPSVAATLSSDGTISRLANYGGDGTTPYTIISRPTDPGENASTLAQVQYQLDYNNAVNSEVTVPIANKLYDTVMTPAVKKIDSLISALGGKHGAFSYNLKPETDPNGTAPDSVGVGLSWTNAAGESKSFWSTVNGERGKTAETIALQLQRLTLASIQAADGIPEIFKSIISGINLTTASADEMTAALTQITGTQTLVGLTNSLNDTIETALTSPFRDLFPSLFKNAATAAVNTADLFNYAHIANTNKNGDGTYKQAGLDAISAANTKYADMNGALRDYIMTLDVAKMSTEDFTAATTNIKAIDGISDLFVKMGRSADTMSTSFITALGGSKGYAEGLKNIPGLQTAMQNYYSNFYTAEEQRAASMKSLSQTFDDLNLVMPTSKQGFRDLVHSIDTTTLSGQELFATMMGLAPMFLQVTEAAAAADTKIAQWAQHMAGVNPGYASTISAQGTYDQAYADLRKGAPGLFDYVDSISKLIHMSPDLMTLNDVINMSRTAYESLTAEQRTLVDNFIKSANDLASANVSFMQSQANADVTFAQNAAKMAGATDKQISQIALSGAEQQMVNAAKEYGLAGFNLHNFADVVALSQEEFNNLDPRMKTFVTNVQSAGLALLNLQDAATNLISQWDQASLGTQTADASASFMNSLADIIGGDAAGKAYQIKIASAQNLIDSKSAELAALGDSAANAPQRWKLEGEISQLTQSLKLTTAEYEKWKTYESQYSGKGTQLLALDKWKQEQMAIAGGNAAAGDLVQQAYDKKFQDIIKTTGSDWANFKKSISTTLRDLGLTETEKKLQSIVDSYDESVTKAKELAAASNISTEELNQVLGQIDQVKQAQINQLKTDFSKSIDDQLATATLSDYKKSLRDINKSYEDNMQSAVTLGLAQSELTKIEQLRTAQLAKLRAQLMNSIEDNISSFGLSSYENSIRQVENAYHDAMQAAVDLGLTQSDLAKIELDRNYKLQNLAKEQLKLSYQKQADELQKTIDKFKQFGDALKKFRTSLDINSSQLSPEQKYLTTKAEFEKVANLAKNGDEQALQDLQGVSQEYLDASKEYFASSTGYFESLDAVKAAVDYSAHFADDQVALATQQLDTLKLEVSKLIDLNDNVIGVQSLITTLNDLQAQALTLLAQIAAGGGIKNATGTGYQYSMTGTDPYNPGNPTISSYSPANQIAALYQAYGISDRLNVANASGVTGLQYWLNDYNNGSTIQEIERNIAAALGAPVRAYAEGGSYPGGYALVGESGPELINFANPGQIYTSGQTREILGSSNSDAVVEELQALIRLQAEANTQLINANRTANAKLDEIRQEFSMAEMAR